MHAVVVRVSLIHDCLILVLFCSNPYVVVLRVDVLWPEAEILGGSDIYI
jgi:hypothetical protein